VAARSVDGNVLKTVCARACVFISFRLGRERKNSTPDHTRIVRFGYEILVYNFVGAVDGRVSLKKKKKKKNK
jgi:hypothetical protein